MKYWSASIFVVLFYSHCRPGEGQDEATGNFYRLLSATPISKQAISEFSRVLFVVGLEGSGHHAWATMMDVCDTSGCTYESKTSALSVSYNSSESRTVGLFAGTDGVHNCMFIAKMLSRMSSLSATLRPQLHYLGLKDVELYGDTAPGMMSYPNGPVEHKTLDRPDVHVLAALAEAAKLDIRFIVLLRGAAAVLHSTVDRRHFGALEPQILIANAESIYTQLQLISPAFYRCVQYENLVNIDLEESQKADLIDFLHPKALNLRTFKNMLSQVRRTTHGGTSNKHYKTQDLTPSEVLNRKYHVQQLQARLNLISNLCSANDAWL